MSTELARERVMHVLLEQRAAKYGERTFVYFGDQEFSFAAINYAANRVASGLQKLGIAKGDKVAFIMDNSPEIIPLVFGISKLGAIVVPINTAHKGDMLTYMLDQSDSRVLVMHRHYGDRIGPIMANTPKLETVVGREARYSEEGPSEISREVGLGKRTLDWQELIDNDGSYRPAEVVWSDPLFILYTSGTTGLSKGVLAPHNLFYSVPERYCRGALELGEDDRLYNFMPLFHVAGWHHGGVNLALMTGASMVLAERFSASKFWDDVKRYGCTCTGFAGGVPSILFKADPRPDDADNPLRVMIGSPMPKEIFEVFEKRFGVRVVEFYGSTEIGPPVMSEFWNRKISSPGRVNRDYIVRIVDDNGNDVGPNTPGELLARPLKPYSMMLEYYKMPEKTVEAWQDLWFHTGDCLYFDNDGYYFFVDRKKDALRRRGENISSFEVEKVINSHPAVIESAVIAVKSELDEDEVMACVTLKLGESVSPAELMDHCAQRMAYFMVPRYLRFVEDLPKTATMRVEKYRLRLAGITSDTWDREKSGYQLRR